MSGREPRTLAWCRAPGPGVGERRRVGHVEGRPGRRPGREPNAEETAEERAITPEEVREILRMAQMPVSLEKPIGEEEDSSLGDFVQDDAAESAT